MHRKNKGKSFKWEKEKRSWNDLWFARSACLTRRPGTTPALRLRASSILYIMLLHHLLIPAENSCFSFSSVTAIPAIKLRLSLFWRTHERVSDRKKNINTNKNAIGRGSFTFAIKIGTKIYNMYKGIGVFYVHQNQIYSKDL